MDIFDETDPDRVDQGGFGGPPLNEAWRRCCARLRAELGDDVFNSWFGRLALVSVGSGQARLSVPTKFLKSWIDAHYVGHISVALNAEFGPVVQILIFVRCSAPLEPAEPADRMRHLRQGGAQVARAGRRSGASRTPLGQPSVGGDHLW